jgi:hypothetical protein
MMSWPQLLGSGGINMTEESDFYLDESTMQGIRECLDKGNTPVRVTEADLGEESLIDQPYLYD